MIKLSDKQASVSAAASTVKQSFVATAGQTTFTIAYTVGYIDVFVNGIKLTDTTDYTATNGTTVVLTVAAVAGDVVDMTAGTSFTIANTYTIAQANAAIANAGLPAWLIKSANYTAVAKDRILANTSAGAFTVTLPATPSAGAEVTIYDGGGAFSTNNLTISRNGSPIVGLAQDLVLDINNDGLNLVYFDGTRGWVITK